MYQVQRNNFQTEFISLAALTFQPVLSPLASFVGTSYSEPNDGATV
jgi:hypothetical protein